LLKQPSSNEAPEQHGQKPHMATPIDNAINSIAQAFIIIEQNKIEDAENNAW
jgi:hypothetical protein